MAAIRVRSNCRDGLLVKEMCWECKSGNLAPEYGGKAEGNRVNKYGNRVVVCVVFGVAAMGRSVNTAGDAGGTRVSTDFKRFCNRHSKNIVARLFSVEFHKTFLSLFRPRPSCDRSSTVSTNYDNRCPAAPAINLEGLDREYAFDRSNNL